MEEENIIYTDYERTSKNVWESYEGWVTHFSNYIMQPNHENILGMRKYAVRVITYTERKYEKFKGNNKLSENEIIIIKQIYNDLLKGKDLIKDDYLILNNFFSKYLDITGITDNVKQKDDINKSILKNR